MKPKARRRCSCCQRVFVPDARNRDRQEFCSQPRCRKASKAASQRRCREKPENKDHWRGPAQVERVRIWRKAHPQYWKRSPSPWRIALQEDCLVETIQPKGSKPRSALSPLQDDCLPQDPLVLGLVSILTGSTLQEDIAATCRHLVTKGHEILRRKSSAEAVASAGKPITRT